MRFRTKTVLGVAAIEIVMLAILVLSVLSVLRDSNQAELERRVQLGSRLLAAAAKDALIAQDLATLDSLLTEAQATNQLDFVRIIAPTGKVLAQQGDSVLSHDREENSTQGAIGQKTYRSSTPISSGGVAYGAVEMGVSTAPLQALLWSSQRWAIGIAAGEMLLVALFSWMLGSYLSRQLVALRAASDDIAKGNLARRLPIKGKDELAETAQAFNHMASELERSRDRVAIETQLRETAQQHLARELVNAEDHNQQLQEIFALLPDGLLAFDRRGTVKYVTPAFLHMLGKTESELIGQPSSAVDSWLRDQSDDPSEWKGMDVFFTALSHPSSGTNSNQLPEPLRNHVIELTRPRSCLISLHGVVSDSTTVGYLLYLRDVTREVELDRMKSEFLAHAAHELRTPMASIFGFSELLINRQFDEERRRDMHQTIHKQAAWLVQIINELLDLARIESGKGKDFHIESVALEPLLAEIAAGLAFDEEHWPIRLDTVSGATMVRADRQKLRQALINVLGNAKKYSPAGGEIIIRILHPEDAATGNRVGIQICDHGIGMTAEQTARVCERFYRADTSGSTPGTGLGMAIVKEVIDRLGGFIEICSIPATGTTVTLWLQRQSSMVPSIRSTALESHETVSSNV